MHHDNKVNFKNVLAGVGSLIIIIIAFVIGIQSAAEYLANQDTQRFIVEDDLGGFTTDGSVSQAITYCNQRQLSPHFRVDSESQILIDYKAEGISIDSEGNIYVTDSSGDTIHKYGPDGKEITITLTDPLGGGREKLKDPKGIVLDSADNIYIVNSGGNNVKKFDKDGVFEKYIGLPTGGTGNGFFVSPSYITLGKFANGGLRFYITDSGNNRVQEFNSSGTFSAKWDGSKSNNKMSNPTGIAVDKDDAIYISDTGNHRVLRFSNGDVFTGYIGDPAGPSSEKGHFDTPIGVVDGSKDIYVMDTENDRIQVFTALGKFVRVIGGAGNNPGEFDNPRDIVFDSSGAMRVLDQGNYRIQKLLPYCKGIDVIKDTNPNDPQDFTFSKDFLDKLDFKLDDDADGTLSNKAPFELFDDGDYVVSETPVSGYETTINCIHSNPAKSISDLKASRVLINLVGIESAICTFTNKLTSLPPDSPKETFDSR